MEKNELGEFLRRIRKEVYDEGVKKFAKRLGIPAWTYRSIEEGRTIHPKKETMTQIEEALSIKLTSMNFREFEIERKQSYRKDRFVATLNTVHERIEREIDFLNKIPTSGKYEMDVDAYNSVLDSLIAKLETMYVEEKEIVKDHWLDQMEEEFFRKEY